MSFYGVLFLSVSCAFSAAVAIQHFQYSTQCTPANAPIQIHSLDLQPNPLLLPGDMTLTIDAETISAISQGATLDLSMKRRGFIDIPIPCISHIGSCHYDDVCGLLDKMERENWLSVMGPLATQVKAMFSSQNISANHCPFAPGHMHLRNYTIQLPHVASGLSSFAACFQSKKEGKDQESIQSSTTSDHGYQWESDNVTIRHHKRKQRGHTCMPFQAGDTC